VIEEDAVVEPAHENTRASRRLSVSENYEMKINNLRSFATVQLPSSKVSCLL
jgi:hypothetical protein